MFAGKKDIKALESSIYQDLLTDPDIDRNTLSVVATKQGRVVKVVVDAYMTTGESVGFVTGKQQPQGGVHN